MAARYRGLRLARAARSTTATTSPAIARALEAARDARTQPSLIVVKTVIGYGAPDKAGSFARARQPAGRRRGEEDQAQPRLARGAAVPHPARGARALPLGARARQDRAGRLERALRRLRARRSPSWRRRSSGASARGCPTAGTRSCRGSPPTPRGWRRARPRRRCCRSWPGPCPSWSAARAISIRRRSRWLKQDGDFESPLRPRDGVAGHRRRRLGLRGPQHPLRRARARDGRGGQRPRLPRRLHPVRRDVPGVLRLHAPADPAVGASRSLRSIWRLHPRQHRRRRGRARRTSRSSSSPALRAIPGMRRAPPVRRQRDARRLAGRAREPRDGRRCWCSRASTCRRSIAARYAPAEGLRRGALRAQPRASRDPELILIAHRLRGVADRRRRADAARARRARAAGVDAVVGAVRASRARRIARACCRARSRARLAVEAARAFGWERWVGSDGDVLSVDRFGASAPGDQRAASSTASPSTTSSRGRWRSCSERYEPDPIAGRLAHSN